MSLNSKIEWTDATWNPIRGCTKISPGCTHCYAETFAERFRGVPGHPYEQGFDLRLIPEKLHEPLRWPAPQDGLRQLDERPVPRRRARRLHRAGLPGDAARRTGTRSRCSPSAPSGCATCSARGWRSPRGEPHIWFGVSVENRKHGLPRIEHLRVRARGLADALGRAAARGPRRRSTSTASAG